MPNVQATWHIKIAPEEVGSVIRETAADLKETGKQVSPQALLYAEKAQGFSCRTCRYATPQNATHGKCDIMTGTIHLDEGCCAAWDASAAHLYLYKEPWMQ